MPEQKVTYEVTVTAIEQLKARGEPITNRSIRMQIGGGSHSTIVKHLQRWRETQPPPVGSDISIPPDVEQALLKFVRHEYSVRLTRLQGELADREQLTQELLSENDRLQSRVDDLESTASESRDEIANLRGQLERMSVELSEQCTALGRARAAHAEADVQLTVASARLHELQSIEAEAHTLRDMLQELQLKLSDSEADAATTREKDALRAVQLSEARQQLEQESQLRIDLERQLIEYAFQVGRARARRGNAARPIQPHVLRPSRARIS